MIKGVLFDLDGTLIDSTSAIIASFHHTFDTLGLPRPGSEAIIQSIGFPLREQLSQLTDHDPDECILVYREHYTRTAKHSTTLLPGARELLEALAAANLPIGFATSKKRSAAEMLLEHLGALHFFAVRIGPEEVTNHKPHPEAVLKAVELMRLSPEHVVFIGDMHFDILAGKAAGVHTLAVSTGYATRAELEALSADGVVDNLRKAAAWLRSQGVPLSSAG